MKLFLMMIKELFRLLLKTILALILFLVIAVGAFIVYAKVDTYLFHYEIEHFYENAGFEGKVTNINTDDWHNLNSYYDYEEIIDGQKWVISINSRYSRGTKGKELLTIEDLAKNYQALQIMPLLREVIFRSDYYDELENKIRETVRLAGGQVDYLSLNDLRYYEWEEDTGDRYWEIVEQLIADLTAAEKAGKTELRGIASLDAEKYLGLETHEIIVQTSDMSWEELDLSNLGDGLYWFYQRHETEVGDDSVAYRVSNGQSQLVYDSREGEE